MIYILRSWALTLHSHQQTAGSFWYCWYPGDHLSSSWWTSGCFGYLQGKEMNILAWLKWMLNYGHLTLNGFSFVCNVWYSDWFSLSHKVEHRKLCPAEVNRNTNKSSAGLDMSHLSTLDNLSAMQNKPCHFTGIAGKWASFRNIFCKQPLIKAKSSRPKAVCCQVLHTYLTETFGELLDIVSKTFFENISGQVVMH